MFSGLSAFPLTPMNEKGINKADFVKLIERLCLAKVDSIGVLGSTGNYAYLTLEQRMDVAELALKHADNIPVIIGISALTTKDALVLAEHAQKIGASAVLLAPMSYQKLSDDEVFSLYETVTKSISIPLCVYDNPGTTHFNFSDQLHARIAQLKNVKSIKIPGVPTDPEQAKQRVANLRSLIPDDVTIGVSGDAFGAAGVNAGCDLWYSVIGGLFPNTTLAIAKAALSGDAVESIRLSEQLEPIWKLFSENNGSLRVVATAAEHLGLIDGPCLPLPLRTLNDEAKAELANTLAELDLH